MKNNIKNNNSGFVALFTVLIASVVLAMAVGIANVSLKQIVLSGSATDANRSFYAADTGIECALYNDLRNSSVPFTNGDTEPIDCGGVIGIPVEELPGFVFNFSFDLPTNLGGSCASVTVDKLVVPGSTKVVSRGTNSPCATPGPRTVERVIEVTY